MRPHRLKVLCQRWNAIERGTSLVDCMRSSTLRRCMSAVGTCCLRTQRLSQAQCRAEPVPRQGACSKNTRRRNGVTGQILHDRAYKRFQADASVLWHDLPPVAFGVEGVGRGLPLPLARGTAPPTPAACQKANPMRPLEQRRSDVRPIPSATCPHESVLPIRLRPDFSVAFEGYAGGAEHWPCRREAPKRSLGADILRTS